MSIKLKPIGTYESGIYNNVGAEIVAHDPSHNTRLFVSSSAQNAVDVLDISDPTTPIKLFSISLAAYGGNVNSVAAKNGIVAVAVQADEKTDAGKVVLFDTNGNELKVIEVGALPDMLTFTPDGTKLLVANEGEAAAGAVPSNHPTLADMTAVNETGPDAGRYIFRAHETGSNAAVTRFDTQTGEFEIIAQRVDFNRFDGLFWTPQGTLLVTEETSNVGAADRDPLAPNSVNGLVYEIIDPTSASPTIVPRPALGSLAHEGVGFDAAGHVYVIDENATGAIYRFTPTNPGDYSAGTLEVLRMIDNNLATNPDRVGTAEWVGIDEADAVINARAEATTVSATTYARPEDVQVVTANGKEFLLIAVTTENRVISIELGDGTAPIVRDFIKTGAGGTIDLATGAALTSDTTTGFNAPDNLAVDADGRIYVSEDRSDGVVTSSGVGNDIWQAVDTNGDGVADQIGRFATLATKGAEPSGIYFDPNDPTQMLVNVQHPTSGNDSTLAIHALGGTFASLTAATALKTSVPLGVLGEGDPFVLPTGYSQEVLIERIPNPEGSISVIDLSAGAANATVSSISFAGFDGKEADLRADGVRIKAGTSASQDFEPEYISVSPDGTLAYVTLQENNAVAVIDLATNTVKGIVPLGLKDYSQGLPELATYEFDDRPALGITDTGVEIDLGGFSGLHFEGADPVTGNLKFVTIGDRGPNGDPINVDGDAANERPFLLPEYQARIVRFELDQATGDIDVTQQILLTRADGVTPITGLPNIPGVDEEPVELQADGTTYAFLSYDAFGGDMEGIALDIDGSFWTVDEYRPAIYHFAADGHLLDRFVPSNTDALSGQPEGTFGAETLPAAYSSRIANRGFEAVALDTENDIVYAFIQTPLANPNSATSSASSVIRILGVDASTGNPVSEHVYLLEKPVYREAGGSGLVDKIGDAVYLGDGKIAVIERDSFGQSTGKQFVFEIDLKGATNVLGMSFASGKTLEQHTPDELSLLGVDPVSKVKVTNLPSLGFLPNDKPEGLAVLDDGSLAVINDNDFGVTGSDTVQLGIISFTGSNLIDASDQDGIDMQHAPVYGMYMPDAIATFQVAGHTYFITANEGDDRGENARISSNAIKNKLDAAAFPDTGFTANSEAGRLNVSSVDGDTDGDGDFDQLLAYGTRSFTIWDQFGNQVFDSGDQFERIVAQRLPNNFNADSTSNTPDDRSDNKGPEPEGVAIGVIDGHTYAFVGLERVGGIMVYDVSDPSNAKFVQYINNRDFSETPGVNSGGDLAPEGLAFIAATDSPNGKPMLAVANEVSGTTTLYEVEIQEEPAYTLQILHASDLEASVDAIERAPNFAAIFDYLEDTYANSISLVAGDTFIPSPFLFAGGDPSLAPMYNSVYNKLFGLPADVNGDTVVDAYTDLRADTGRADITLMNIVGFDAASLGNHEFDLGTTVIRNAIQPDYQGAGLGNDRWVGAQFPYLASNLDFSADTGSSGLAQLFTPNIVSSTAFDSGPAQSLANVVPKKLAPATIIEEGGETIGVIGVDTPLLESISSAGKVQVIGPETDDDAALTILAQTVIQPVIDALTAMGVNKIIIASQLQQIDNEQFLATQLDGVDVIIAGGSDTLLADAEDVSRGLQPGDTPDGDYPFVTQDISGNDVLVVSLDGHYSYVGRLVVDFDADGHIIAENLDPDVIGAYATTDAVVTSLWGNATDPFADGTKGDLAQEVVDAVEDLILVKDSNIIGRTDVFLEGRRSEVRTEETNLGNLTADANLALAQQSDPTVLVSIKNGGGIRDAIGTVVQTGPGQFELAPPQANPLTGKETGEISQLDIENSLRFNNGLSLVTVTAAQLLQVLEHAVAAVAPGATPGQFGQVGGVEFSYDPTRAAGDRVLSAAIVDDNGNVLDVLAANGDVFGDPSRAIRVVTLTFLLTGGDSYPFQAFIAANPDFAHRVDLLETGVNDVRSGQATFAADGSEQDALSEYLMANYPADDNASTPVFSAADSDPALDERIQNLAARDDDVLDGLKLGTSGNDTLGFGSAADIVFAGAGDDKVNAGIGDDTVHGDAGNDKLDGGNGNDVLDGGAGNDTVGGGNGDDLLDGAAGNDSLIGGNGNDHLVGGSGEDTLDGGNGEDLLEGGAGNDWLKGGNGQDVIDGGAGNDLVEGGNGHDVFVFETGSGVDIVRDFKPNQDVIDLGDLFSDFSEVQGLMSQAGANVQIALGGGNQITLNNVNLATIDATEFVF